MQGLPSPPSQEIDKLLSTATNEEIINKLNEMIDNINYLLEGHIQQ